MLTKIRKLNAVPVRMTALALLAVVIATLLVACVSSDEEDPIPRVSEEDSGGGGTNMILLPIITITTPPVPGNIQTLEVIDGGNGWQNMRIDVSGVVPFQSLAEQGRRYFAFSSTSDKIAVSVTEFGGIATVTASAKGNTVVTVTAVQFDGTDSGFYSFTVIAPNRAPTVANSIPSSMNAVVGTAFNYRVPDNTFSDPDTDPLTYTASTRPYASWLTFDASSRTFTGTPCRGQHRRIHRYDHCARCRWSNCNPGNRDYGNSSQQLEPSTAGYGHSCRDDVGCERFSRKQRC